MTLDAYLYLYKYENVCVCVCVPVCLFVCVFLGHLEPDWDILWYKVALCFRNGSKTIKFQICVYKIVYACVYDDIPFVLT